MKEIEFSTQWIDRYGDDDLNEQEKQEFRRRMEVSPVLKSEVSIDAKITRFLQDPDTIELMQKIREIADKPYVYSQSFSSLMLAASLICLLTFGSTYYLMRIDPVKFIRYSGYGQMNGTKINVKCPSAFQYFREGGKIATITPVTRRAKKVKNTWDERYSPMMEFELLVGVASRSGSFKLLSPDLNIEIKSGEEAKFSWVCPPGNQPVTILLMNNRGKTVLTSPEIIKSASYTIRTSVYGKGLFYWKIIVNDEILKIGKMVVK